MEICMLVALYLFVLLGAGIAQDKPQDSQQAVPERICFSALDRSEKPVLGLTAKDFTLRVNSWPAELQDFRLGRPSTDRSVPLVAWILLDWNPNINAVMISDQAAAAARVFELLHPDSAVGVKLVSDRSATLAPLAHDSEALRKAFMDFRKNRTELSTQTGNDGVIVGPGGILRVMELAMEEMDTFVFSQPSLQGKEIQRALLLLSDANINPSYPKRPLFENAARMGVYFYPIFMPRSDYGYWVQQYFKLGKESGGLGFTFGAMSPGSNIFRMPRENRDPNALTFNFLNIVRDLNGKYSFAAPSVPPHGKIKLELRCLKSNVSIRLPRKSLP